MKNFLTGILSLILTVSLGQDIEKYAALIDTASLKDNLSILASDALEGRLTGSRGQKMAGAFIADHFKRIGLTPGNKGSLFQPFDLYSYKQSEISIATKSGVFSSGKDVVYYGSIDSGGPREDEVVFVGYGTEAELLQVSVRGKVALLIAPELSFQKLGPIIGKLSASGASSVMMYSTVPDAEYATFMGEIQGTLSEGRMSLKRVQPDEIQMYFVSRKVVNALFGPFEKLKALIDNPKKVSLKKVKPAKATFVRRISEETVTTENVLGVMEGTDKKDEFIVITAHYDHIGKTHEGSDLINNGADDDGSGTVAVLQVASAFAKAKKEGHGPRRSILFMTVSAEELGLYGSQFYTDTDPVIPLDRTVVDINIDMIGRWDGEHKGKEPYVYVIGADKLSSELQDINVRSNEKYTKLAFDYTYNDENHPTNLYQRSDHWNFAKHNIPIVFFFDGIHEDYHKPSDEVSKIDFALLARRSQLVFYTAWEIANREKRLAVDR